MEVDLSSTINTYQSQSSPRMLRRCAVNQHVGPWGHDCRVDEAQKEEAAYQCADDLILGIRVLPLYESQIRTCYLELYIEKTHPGETPDLLADPPDAVWRLLQTFDDGAEERIGYVHQLC